MSIERLKRRIEEIVLNPTDEIKEVESHLKEEIEREGFDYATLKKVVQAERKERLDSERGKADLVEYSR